VSGPKPGSAEWQEELNPSDRRARPPAAGVGERQPDIRDRRRAVTGEEWDTHWWAIYNDLTWGDRELPEGPDAEFIADREMSEHFGPRPEEVAS